MNNRRNFLKASLVATGGLFLPSFAALGAPAATGLGPRRFVFIRKSNGTWPKELALPTFTEKQKKMEANKEAFEVDLDKHELPSWFAPVAKYKANMSILQGLSSRMSENGHASYSSIMGAYNSGRNSLSGIKRATVDFELAKLFPSPLEHVELSFASPGGVGFNKGIVAGYSAPAAHQRNFAYSDPQTAYDEIFKAVVNPKAIASDTLILDHLQREEDFKARNLLGYQKLKLSHHVKALESLKKQNKKLSNMSGSIAKHLPTIDPIHLNGGTKANTYEKQEAMTDVLVSALGAGLTNVVTYTIDTLGTPIIGLPGNENDFIQLHNVGHGTGYSGVDAAKIREKVRIEHMKQVAKIVEGLKAMPEGNGTMFDNTVVMYFPEGGDGHHSKGVESPWVILAGENCKLDMIGRYTRLPHHGTEGHKTIGNFYTTLLNAYGNPIKHYGDLDTVMTRNKLPQLGAIKQIMV
jgi:hypothetical protein